MSTTIDIFEKGAREKVRFTSPVGVQPSGLLTSENLFDLGLPTLDRVAQAVNKELKASEEESFIKRKSKASSNLELKLNIVKRVIEIKQEEEDAKLIAAEKRRQKNILLEARAKKQDENFGSLSLEEIDKKLAELEA